MSELYTAYAEYLERMLQESDDLVIIDSTTVPDWVNVPLMEEWSDLD